MANSVKAIMRELVALHAKPPAEGVKLIETSDFDILDIQAWLAGPDGTPFAGGIFRIRLVPGPDFPESPPKGFFLTKIFHPNVSSSGEICVNTLKKDWSPTLGIAHVLLTIRCLLIAPNAESALNDDAGKLLLDDYNAFARRARIHTALHARVPVGPHPFPELAALKGNASCEALSNVVSTNADGSESRMYVDEDVIRGDGGVPVIALAACGPSLAMQMGQSHPLPSQAPPSVLTPNLLNEDVAMEGPAKKRALVDGGGSGRATELPLFEKSIGTGNGGSALHDTVELPHRSAKKRSLRRL